MSISPSSMKLSLVVHKLPSNCLALTNRVYVCPWIFAILATVRSDGVEDIRPLQYPFVTVGEHSFEVEAHPDVQKDQICLNRLQRRTCLLRPGERVKVAPFKHPERLELGALFLEVSFLSSQSFKDEIDTDNLATCLLRSHKGHYFGKGQTIAIDFEGVKLLLTVKQLVKNGSRVESGFTMGRMISLTHLNFQMQPNVSAKCVGTHTHLERGFLNILWRKGAPLGLLKQVYDSCFDAIRANAMVPHFSGHYVETDLLYYALEIMAPLEVVQYIVETFPKVLEMKGIDEPLHFACSCSSSLEVIQYLVDKSPGSIPKKSLSGNNPLHLTCLSEKAPSKGVLEFLFQNNRSALTGKNNLGWTPLHCSCATKLHLGVIQSLVKECPEALEIQDEQNCLPLHLACGFPTGYETPISAEIVKILVDKNPLAAKEKNRKQQIPLHCACWSCPPIEVAELLVEHYPQSITMRDFSNLTPLGIVEGILSAPQGTGFLSVNDVGIEDNKHKMNAELLNYLTVLQSSLDPSLSINEIVELLIKFSDVGWRGGVGLVLDAHSFKLHYLLLDDVLIPELMGLIRQRCKLVTMMQIIKGMPGLFENVQCCS